MLGFLWNLGAFIVALGLLVTVHEFGHFWVARRCGVKVERFSIGFGKPIWRRMGKDGTEYVVAMIPLGGYVKMLDGRVDDISEQEAEQAFDRKPVGQRIAVVAAGPLANFALALVLLFAMFLIGVPTVKPVLTAPVENSIAARAGLPDKSVVTQVAGEPVADWEAFNLALAAQIGADRIPLTLVADGDSREQQFTLDTRSWTVDPDKEPLTTSLGLQLWTPTITTELAFVDEEGAGYAAGLREGDRITHVDGEPVNWEQLVAAITASADQALTMDIERDGGRQVVTVTPRGTVEEGQLVGKVGIAPLREPWPEAYRLDLKFGPLAAAVKAADRTWELTTLTLGTFVKLLTGDLSVKNLGGPIAIAQGAGASAGVGLVFFLGFLALLSVNLGIINLFPLPVLDGGHLLYYFIELLTGKPVPERAQEIGFRIGSALLLLLMSIAIVNDVARL
ncbi:sigma E protease regulator RseP [Ferrimonas marina]|uniref:Zinc metalloprotease n=1 Tax=Ferrimonas marina TaxID=299255 RepID=A0A1M5YFA2_9GAMM|nr:sigma E protease regulator RseP [Ferrimonas marina]SHI10730.1 regulator of sigma E protease [Ferrimonas marina]